MKRKGSGIHHGDHGEERELERWSVGLRVVASSKLRGSGSDAWRPQRGIVV